MKSNLIAPCGMNCNVCERYLRDKNRCPGCPDRELNCGVRDCKHVKKDNLKFCYQCNEFPCDRIKRMDKRYRTKYGMSMIENLEFIKEKGLKRFVANETKRWVSPEGTFCVHNKKRYK